jgi:hypothetical protein
MLSFPAFAASRACHPLCVLLAVSAPACAQTTVSVNLEYAEGKYGETEKSTSWTMPLIIKQQVGDLGLKLNVPYVRATGTAAAGGDRFTTTKQNQEGIGDVVATATYDIVGDESSGLTIAVGGKAKLATADRRNDLITTGKSDYSLLLDAQRDFGATTAFATVGWTRKGDPDGVDYRNPWFSSLGLSRKLSGTVTAGAFYDYRQKLTASADPVSEATLFVELKLSAQYKLQAYLVRGFSDASPELAAGVTLSSHF